MATLRDRLWLWGQSPDAHWEHNNYYHLPGHSRMSAVEGLLYFDIPNICRVRMMGHPQPPYDQESIAMRPAKEVVWSLLGAGGEPVTEWGDMEEVIRQAQMFPNITGGVFDDFFLAHRIAHYTPERLCEMKKKIAEAVGRPLDLWVVCYEDKLDSIPGIAEYLRVFDVITYWTWKGSELSHIERNLERIRAMAPDARILCGCYMWNYGEKCAYTREQMEYQTELYLRLMRAGEIEGIVVCSNCIADLGIENVEYMREWIAAHKDERLPDAKRSV